MSGSFGAYSRYYDLLYADKDYSTEARFVHELIQRYAPGATRILDLGCGTGAHAVQFAELGYEVFGVDASEGMLRSAHARRARMAPEVATRLNFSVGDIRSVRLGREFDAVVALFHVLSYQVKEEDLALTFETAASHLAPGGIFLFDCWYGPAVLADPPGVRVKRLQNQDSRLLRIAEPTLHVDDNLADVDYQVLVIDQATGQVEEIRERHRMRYMFDPELRRLSRAAGLEPIHFSRWLSDAAPSDSSWSVVMAARAMSPDGG